MIFINYFKKKNLQINLCKKKLPIKSIVKLFLRTELEMCSNFYLFNKNFLLKNKIYFLKGYYEDILFMLKVFFYTKKFYIFNKKVYLKMIIQSQLLILLQKNMLLILLSLH